MSNVAINIAAEFKGKPAFDKASSATANLEKSVKKLGKTLGISLSTALVVNFGKRAAQAFMQDEKEANRLAQAVKNLGLEFANPAIAAYIDKLAAATGVTDGQLRPAFQSLLTTTGSLTKSQELLAQAIDISAGSGIDLATVSQDLANGYIGITKGLKKYNTGLSQTQLKTMSFEQIQAKLNAQFSGANAAYLETYAGKMSLLGVAAGEAQEKIGQAVIDLGMAITNASNIDDFIEKIENGTDRIVGILDRITTGIQIIRAWLSGKTWQESAEKAGDAWLEAWNRKMRRDYMKAWEGVDIPLTPAQKAALKKADEDARRRARELKKEEEKRTKELKKQTALKKAGTVFDLDQIQILAALQKDISEDDRKRLQAQAAILNGNADLATKLTKDILMAQDKTGGLYQYFLSIGDAKIKNPFAFLDEWIIKFQEKLNSLKMPNLAPATASAANNVSVSGVPIGQPWSPGYSMGGNNTPGASFPDTNIGTIPTGNFTYGAGNPLMTDVYIPPIEIRVSGEGDLTDAIAKSLQNKSLSTGDSAYINRRTGGFAG